MSNQSIEIELGARVCEKIKRIFFADVLWSDAVYSVADKFTELKNIMRKIYPDRKTYDIVKELANYSQQDIEDVFG